MQQNNDEYQRPNYYGVLPANVRFCFELPPLARLLYVEISALCNMRGECTASNNYLAMLYKVKPNTISELIGAIKDQGFISIRIDKDAGNKRVISIVEEGAIPKKRDRGITKKEDTLYGKNGIPIRNKPNRSNSTSNSTDISNVRTEKNADLEKKMRGEMPPSSAPPPTVIYEGSQWAGWSESVWRSEFSDRIGFDGVDCDYYRGRVATWSKNKGAKSADWLGQAVKFALDDKTKIKILTETNHVKSESNEPIQGYTTAQQGAIDRTRRYLEIKRAV